MEAALVARIAADISDLKSKMGEAGGVVGGFQEHIAKIGPQIAAAFSIGAIVAFGKAAINAAGEAIDGENRLLVALKGREDIQARLLKQADEIAGRTLFEDDDIIRHQGLLAAMGRSEAQIKRIISASTQLAAVTGVDLAVAVEALNKTYEGQEKSLKSLDPTLHGFTQAQLESGEVIDIVNEKYKGYAESMTQVGSGPIKDFTKTIGELTEEIGKLILPTVNSGMSSLTATIKALTNEDVSKWEKFKNVMLALWTNNPTYLANMKTKTGGATSSWGPDTRPPEPLKVKAKKGGKSNVAPSAGPEHAFDVAMPDSVDLDFGPSPEQIEFARQQYDEMKSVDADYYAELARLNQEDQDNFEANQKAKAEQAATFGSIIGHNFGLAAAGMKTFEQAMRQSAAAIISVKLNEALAGLYAGIMSTVPFPFNIGLISAGQAFISSLFSGLGSGGGSSGGGGTGSGGGGYERKNTSLVNGPIQAMQITGSTFIEGDRMRILWSRTDESNAYTKPSYLGG